MVEQATPHGVGGDASSAWVIGGPVAAVRITPMRGTNPGADAPTSARAGDSPAR